MDWLEDWFTATSRHSEWQEADATGQNSMQAQTDSIKTDSRHWHSADGGHKPKAASQALGRENPEKHIAERAKGCELAHHFSWQDRDCEDCK